MATDTLDALFEQFERDTREFERQYGSWLSAPASGAPEPACRAPVASSAPRAPAAPPAPRAPAAPHKEPDPPDTAAVLRERQMQGLRRKYGACTEPERLRPDGPDLPRAWSGRPLAELGGGELYLRAQSELARGKMTDQAVAAVQLLHQRPGRDLFRRDFLYVFSMVQQPASLQTLENAAEALPGEASGMDACDYALYALHCMARYLCSVTNNARQLREKGYRDRQKVLEEAQRQAQAQLDQARRDLDALRR